MRLSCSAQRIVLPVLALFCVVLIGWSLLQVGQLIVQARTMRLDAAGRAIAQAAAPSIRQDRIPVRLVQSVQALIDERQAGLDFVTVRNAANVTLVSRGRLGENGLAWLPFGDARALRGWLYRLRTAQVIRPIEKAGRRVGFAHYGITWTGVVYQAGMSVFVWATALLAGLIGLFGLLMRGLAPAADAPRAAAAVPESRVTTPTPKPMPGGLSLSRFLGRKAPGGSAFEPIGVGRGAAPSPVRAGSPEPRRATVNKPGPPPIVARVDRLVDEPADERVEEPEPAQSTQQPASAQREKPPPQAPTSASAASTPSPTALPGKSDAPTAAPSEAVFAAPQVDARPELGDTTLDLRFYPIWRGDAGQRVLAGACAALAWRAGAAELVDADALTRLAEQDGALRAFTQWIARRFSLLHGNWRTLELPTVPIVLPIPSAMLAFADAEAVWRDALRRTDRDPNDLILRLGSPTVTGDHASLPLRHARPAPDDNADALPEDCDVLCVTPQQVNGDAGRWRARFDALDRPVLFGPVTQPDDHPDIIGHERVLWFSEQPADIHSPRSFARLLVRNATAPI